MTKQELFEQLNAIESNAKALCAEHCTDKQYDDSFMLGVYKASVEHLASHLQAELELSDK